MREDIHLVFCVPAREEDRQGIPWEPSPGATYEEFPCDHCSMPVMLGALSKEKRDSLKIPALCPNCTMKAIGAARPDRIVSLDLQTGEEEVFS